MWREGAVPRLHARIDRRADHIRRQHLHVCPRDPDAAESRARRQVDLAHESKCVVGVARTAPLPREGRSDHDRALFHRRRLKGLREDDIAAGRGGGGRRAGGGAAW
eukprot:7094304-Prymnesium_polylepis.1